MRPTVLTIEGHSLGILNVDDGGSAAIFESIYSPTVPRCDKQHLSGARHCMCRALLHLSLSRSPDNQLYGGGGD